MRDLHGATALITGGASGIGAAFARAVVARGARVVLADLDESAGRALADELGGTFVRTDVRRPEDLAAAVAVAEEAYGRLDVVHLNAGLATGGMTLGEDFDVDRYRLLVDVNLHGVVYGVHAALPALRRAGGGAVVATSSLSGLTPFPGDALYAASKHAVVGLVRSLAEPLAADGITIAALCPGFTDTPLVAPFAAAFRDFPLLEAEDVAAAALAAIDGGGSGEAWVVQPGRVAEPYRFRGVPGPGEHQAPPEAVRTGEAVR
ncbi:MAG TPA: SDR family NAD(P)-dependent oxidoreductase [Mycobacteriales bacterium]|jgi:NAD(P)-dependent dehydrogenase (short-subunit alcohol dehydrogenase family)|nr:SDR family NAD(P)-dependent oxidoreductase [Mycobacteriales bacterium]